MSRLRITAAHFPVRFWWSFRHASASRSRALNIIALAQHGDGLAGYGEGCPRDYVTGETLATAQRFFTEHADAIAAEVFDLDTLQAWIASHAAPIDDNPAVFAAIEIALLDLFAKRAGQPLEIYLGLPPLQETLRYSAVLGDSAPIVFALQAALFRSVGFVDYKMKLAAAPERNEARMRFLRRLVGPRLRIRADANNMFATSDHAIAHLARLSDALWAVEEPLQRGDIAGMRALANATGLPIILDESAQRLADLDALAADPRNWIVNLRISKMGGIMRSLAFLEKASAVGVRVILGAHVGESSILTRAAITLANSNRTALTAQEGAYGTWLLRRDICPETLKFGRGGLLRLADWSGRTQIGLGLATDPGRLAAL